MSTDAPSSHSTPDNSDAVHAPMRTVALGVLSMFVDCAAANIGLGLPSDDAAPASGDRTGDLSEARLAIDAANALLRAVGRALSNDERLSIESLLTQLQIEYVKRVGV
jgi:hypothetical protein